MKYCKRDRSLRLTLLGGLLFLFLFPLVASADMVTIDFSKYPLSPGYCTNMAPIDPGDIGTRLIDDEYNCLGVTFSGPGATIGTITGGFSPDGSEEDPPGLNHLLESDSLTIDFLFPQQAVFLDLGTYIGCPGASVPVTLSDSTGPIASFDLTVADALSTAPLGLGEGFFGTFMIYEPSLLTTFTRLEIGPTDCGGGFGIDNLYYSVDAVVNAAAGDGGTISPEGTTPYAAGSNPTYTITPDLHYHISNVYVDGLAVGPMPSYGFTNITGIHSIFATFGYDVYNIAVSYTGNGSIQICDDEGCRTAGQPKVPYGGSVTLSINPAPGYHIEDVIVDSNPQGQLTSYAFTNVDADHTLAVMFEPNALWTITATAGPNGTINPGTVQVPDGTSKTFTITANQGYRIGEVKVDNVALGRVVVCDDEGCVTTGSPAPTGTSSSYTFISVNANHTIAATFVPNTYTITASAGSGGSITPSGSTTVPGGQNQLYTITPAPGYKILSVFVDGYSKGAVSSYTFTNVGASHTIVANFSVSTYEITITKSGSGSIMTCDDEGCKSVSGKILVTEGSSKTFTMTPSMGYYLQNVFLDNVSQVIQPGGTYTLSNVTAPHTLNVVFAANPSATITAMAFAGGTITPSGTINVPSGSFQTFKITPNLNFKISNVRVDGVLRGPRTSYTFTFITPGSHSIVATFAPK